MAILIEDHSSSPLSAGPPRVESCNKSPIHSSQPSLPTTSCTICHSPFNTPHQDGTFETPSILPCAHIFGSLCIKQWLESSKHQDCPNCRREMRYVGCGHAVIPKLISISTSKSTPWNRDEVDFESGSGSDVRSSLKAVSREDMPALCLLCRESREMEEVVRRAERRLTAEERALEGLRGALPGLFGGLYKGNGMGMMDFEGRTGEVRESWKSEMEVLTEGLRGRMEGREEW